MEISFIQLMQNWREYYYLFVFFVGERHSDFHFDCYSPSRPFALIIRHLFIYSCIYLFLIISIYLFYFFFFGIQNLRVKYWIYDNSEKFPSGTVRYHILQIICLLWCGVAGYISLVDYYYYFYYYNSIMLSLFLLYYFILTFNIQIFTRIFIFFPFNIEYDIPRLSLFVLSVFASFYALFKWNLIFFAYNNNLFFLSFVARWLVEILLALRLETMWPWWPRTNANFFCSR